MPKIVFLIITLTIWICTPFFSIYNKLNAQENKFVVVLDAGHGGKDPGALGSNKRVREKDIVLDIALQAGNMLKNNCPDVKVIYTRSKDVFVTLDKRAEIANKAKADLFISIHTNAVENRKRRVLGVQSYTLTLKSSGANLEVEKRENSVIQFEEDGESKYSFSNPNSSESDIIFELMQDRDMKESVDFAKIVQHEMVNKAKRQDKGVLQANLAVLRKTYMPSVLLEVGFISTPAEEKYLNSKNGKNTLAKCIYNAVVKYKEKYTGHISSLVSISPEENSHLSVNEKTSQNEEQAINNKESSNNSISNAKPVFKIQILATEKRITKGDKQFKGLTTSEYKENGLYKYTYGETSDYNEILKLKKNIAKKFPKSFIIAFKSDKKIDTKSAIEEFKLSKK
ncbi:MAG: N-acetylmuramoyl-L-alanine amidase [Bacteroidaceae bacterium]|nr:N-acetylmuramoyl-L-alanine amidase [Bacteroidaceae bacterium]